MTVGVSLLRPSPIIHIFRQGVFPCYRRVLEPRRHLATSAESTAIEVTDPVALYENLCRSGRIQWDEEQFRLLIQLRRVHTALVDYTPSHTLRYLLETPTRESVSGQNADSGHRLILPNSRAERSLVRALTDEDDLSTLNTPVGALLTGDPGTGKTMLLDLFYKSLPVKKSRIHYHAFLLSLYRKVFLALEQQRVKFEDEEYSMQQISKQGDGQGYPWSRREENKAKALTKGWQQVFAGGRKTSDPSLMKEYVLANIALDMIKEATVLAFDEIQLVDIAGAGILRRVLTWYWRLGGVVIGTSNRLPSDLYQQGVQREQFRIFLNHLQERCPVYELRSEKDWRRRDRQTESAIFDLQEEGVPDWTSKFTRDTAWFLDTEAFESQVAEIVGNKTGEPKSLRVYGRPLAVPWQIEGEVARFTFSGLCEKALGPADYLSLTSQYPCIILTDIPQLKLSAKNEARRFISFLDAAYESKCRLVCHAAAQPDDIFFPDAAQVLNNEDNPLTADMLGEVMQDLEAPFRPNISEYREADVQMRVEEIQQAAQVTAPAFRNLAIFTGQDEQFAYKRALSRIFEITSKEYVKTARHTPVPAEIRVWEHSKPAISKSRPPWLPNAPQQAAETQAKATIPRGVKVNPLNPDIEVSELPKPKIGTSHFWGVVDTWGAKAGLWGQGTQAKRSGIQREERKQRAEMMQKQDS